MPAYSVEMNIVAMTAAVSKILLTVFNRHLCDLPSPWAEKRLLSSIEKNPFDAEGAAMDLIDGVICGEVEPPISKYNSWDDLRARHNSAVDDFVEGRISIDRLKARLAGLGFSGSRLKQEISSAMAIKALP